MKVGFFGDSYCDLYLKFKDTPRFWKPWPRRLIEDNNYTCVNSGVGGSSLFHAITQWNDFLTKSDNQIDLAIWTFTWEDRLYHKNTTNQEVFLSVAEKRRIQDLKEYYNNETLLSDIELASKLYYEYIYSIEYGQYVYRLLVDQILDLPNKHKDTKFIFIPNTEFARTVTLEKFTRGVLLDFAFETLSNREVGSPGIMPLNCGRIGHISDQNAEIFKSEIENIISNYQSLENTVIRIDYDKFDIVK